MSHGTLDEKAELVFSLYDFDGSRSLSKDELTVLMNNTLTSMNVMQNKQPPSINEVAKKTDEFFLKADTNKDQKISLKEFKNYLKTDKQILECLMNQGLAQKEDLGTDFGAGDQSVPDIDEDLESEINPKGLQNTSRKSRMKEGIDFDEFGEDEVEEADQFMSIKPCKGVIDNTQPRGYKVSSKDGQAPNSTLQLDHVHGFRCHDVRNNLRYTQEGDIAYIAAGLGVIIETQTKAKKQRFFMDHTDDIHCIALHPTKPLAATGQIGPKPRLCIWNTETMTNEVLITQPLTKGIKHLAWSPNGKYLAASAMDDDQMMAVFDMDAPVKPGKPREPIAHGKSTRAKILSLTFSPDNKTVVATCVKEIVFLTITGKTLKGKKGTGDRQRESILTGAFVG